MKRTTYQIKLLITVILTFAFNTIGFGQSDVMISQYIETSSGTTPKGIEIFNISGADITFSVANNLQIYQGTNGGACAALAGTNITSGTLLADEVWVIGTTDLTTFATTNGTNLSGTTNFNFSFNGDDALQVYLGGVLQDEFGTCGIDPGSSWSGSGVSTANNNLQIIDGICDGETSGGWSDPSTRFTQIANGLTMTGFGDAPASCSGCTPTHTITGFVPAFGPIGTLVTISGTGFTAGTTVEFNGVSAAVTFVNTTTLTATVPAGATTGVITVTEAGCPLDSASDFTVTACAPTHTIIGFTPSTGPELTEVTITGTGFTAGTTVDFGGVSAAVVSQTATQIVAEVPVGATTGVITLTEAGCPLDSLTDFTVIDNSNCSLSGGMPAGFTDLLISGVYDDETDSCHYIELLNPTAFDIDLTSYSLGLDNNFTLGSAVPTSGFSGGVLALSGTIAAESTIMVRLSASGACTSCPTISPDLSFTNGGVNDQDRIVLFNDVTTTALDVWQNHSNGAGYNVGYVFARDQSSTAPTTTFNNADWIMDGNEDCFGFAISSTLPPTVDMQPSDVTNCSSTSFSITASAGNGGVLTYQWKYNDGSASGWSDVTSAAFTPGIVTGETSNSLTITGFNLEGYQFYCDVTEDSACTVSSNSAQFKVTTTTWDGSVWSTGSAPTINDNAVINGDYDTATYGSFSTCQLFINSGSILTVDNSTYVEVENDVIVQGEILVETQGAFVQNNDSGGFILDTGGVASVNKSTTVLNQWYNYTYWSSPVVDETIGTGLDIAPSNRRFWFNASNYLDVFTETNNDNTLIAGHDDIDDNGDDWQVAAASTTMTPGVGYAATVSPIGFVVGTYQVNFEGEFNNGVITTAIAYNGANGDNDWNFIGNPYPSAIDSNVFFTTNSGIIGGAVYLWSQNTPPSDTTNGNENQNFAQADYAIITQSGVNIAGGDGIIPSDYIPSGQGFFVQGLANSNVTFNNSMRMADGSSNNQFFRFAGIQNKNTVWIDLTSDNGVYNQIALGYHDRATDGNDGFAFDATRNLSTGNGAIIYSRIDGNDKKFAIQGKASSSFTDDERVSLGFTNYINDVTNFKLSIAQVEGLIIENIPVYLEDKLLGIEHNLSDSEYSFTSETGDFKDRFEVLFKISDKVIDDILATDELIVSYNNSKELNFSTTLNSEISNIRIFDMLGRELVNFDAQSKTNIGVNSAFMSSTIYIAKVKTSDGRIFTKKIFKP